MQTPKVKLLLNAIFLLAFTPIFAQIKPVPALVQTAKDNGTTFLKTNIFSINKEYPMTDIQKAVSEATILKLNTAALSTLLDARPTAIELTLPYKNGSITVELVNKSVLSEDFSVVTNEGKTVDYQKGLYFRGQVKGNSNSLVAISFFKNEVYGMISDERNGDIVLGKIDNKDNIENYILYADNDLLIKNPFTCESVEPNQAQKNKMLEAMQNNASRNVNGCVRSFLECDFKLYQNKGSSVANTVNYITAVYNNIATIYNNEQVSTVTSQVYVWVTQDAYPTTSSSSALNSFKSTRGTNYNGDLAHLAALGGSGLGGVAWLDVLCFPSYGYAYSNISSSFNTVPTYSWTVEVMTHEMGHNLGSPHTQSCSWPGGAIDNCYTTEGGCPQGPAPVNGGTIMSYCHLTSYGINFNNGFGPLPGQLIRDYVSTATCLAASCAAANTCLAPTTISTSNVTANSASISWTAPSGATSFNLRYRAQGTSAWTTINNATNPQVISGLLGNTNYGVEIQTVCGTGSSNYSTGIFFKTQISTTPCDAPTNLTSSNITQTAATMTWDAVSGASNYIVQYKLSTATTWTALAAVTTTSVNLTSLQSNKSYDVQVMCNCTSGNYSAYSSTSSFLTLGCDTPTNIAVANITTASASVNWTAAFGAVSYNIQYKTAAATTWTTKTSTTPTYNITGLVQNTNYDLKVQTVCASTVGSSAYSASQAFTTATCQLPTTVTVSNIAQNNATATWDNPSNATSFKLQWRRTGTTTWSSATVTNALTYNFTGLTPNQQYDLQVQVVCTGGSTAWSATQNFTTAACPTVAAVTFSNVAQNTATATWQQVLNINSYKIQWKLSTATTWTSANVTGTTYNFTNLTPNRTYDVQVTTNCTNGSSVWSATQNFTTDVCPTVAAVTFSNVAQNTATATWQQVLNINSYKIQWKLSTATTWSSANVTGTTYNFTNLTPDRTYDVQVTTNCTNGSSVWSATQNFTTAACPTVAAVTFSNVAPNTATAAWQQVLTINSYKIQWKLSTATTWSSANVTGTTYNFTNLTPDRTYDVQVTTNCTNGSSVWSATQNFTTPICPLPTNVVVSDVSINTATVSWTASSSQLAHNIQWRKVGATTWTSASVTGTTYGLTNLTANTAYEVQVRTNCPNNQSLYTVSSNFTTLANPVCAVPTGLVASNLTMSSLTLDWNSVVNALNYSIQYKLSTSTTWITINGITASPYTLSGLNAGATYNVKIRTNCAGNNNSSAYSAQINVTLPTTITQGTNSGNNSFAAQSRENDDNITNPTENQSVIVAPNPVQNYAYVHYKLKKQSKVNMQLINSLGQVMYQEENYLQQGMMILDMSKYAAGFYTVRSLIDDNTILTNSLIKE